MWVEVLRDGGVGGGRGGERVELEEEGGVKIKERMGRGREEVVREGGGRKEEEEEGGDKREAVIIPKP